MNDEVAINKLQEQLTTARELLRVMANVLEFVVIKAGKNQDNKLSVDAPILARQALKAYNEFIGEGK